jgi:hypothetical protein
MMRYVTDVPVGTTVGVADGRAVVGVAVVGIAVGVADGIGDGAAVGSGVLGLAVVGTAVSTVGCWLGAAEGDGVGKTVVGIPAPLSGL